MACHQDFDETKLEEFDGLSFCPQHFLAIKNSPLKVFKMAVVNGEDSSAGIEMHEKQLALMSKGEICYIKASYEIHDDTISTVMKLMVIA